MYIDCHVLVNVIFYKFACSHFPLLTVLVLVNHTNYFFFYIIVCLGLAFPKILLPIMAIPIKQLEPT